MLENKPLVTAVITTYRREPEIVVRAAKSVLQQTYENIELFIVNDYPEDEKLSRRLKKAIENLEDSRVVFVCHEKNKGACAARNTGIRRGTGEYVALLDDDDEWMSDKVETMLSAFKEDTGLVYSSFYLGEPCAGKVVSRGDKSGYIKREMLCKNLISGTSMPMIRRECFDDCGMFDEKLLSSQDYDMWMRITLKYPVVYVDRPLTIRHFSNDCITTNTSKRKQGWDYFTIKYMEYYKEDPYLYNYRLNAIVNASFMIGEFKYGFEKYKVAVKVRLFSIQNILCPLKGVLKYILNRRYQ
ncbi:MAG: glycosyltransferase [Oliverpabstia sp.]|nr:glycosyltransferase [Oliverpabstia sp.]